MPWALGAGLGEVGAAVFLALCCMAVVYLLRAIGAALPVVNLIIASIDLGKIWLSVTKPIVSWLVGATNQLWADAEWWLRGISYIFNGLFHDITGLFDTHSVQIAHLHNAVIPLASGTAVTQAAAHTSSEIAALNRAIATARADFAKVAHTDSVAELQKAEALIGTVEHHLTAIAATGVRTSERYADRQRDSAEAYARQEVARLRSELDQRIGALPAPIAGATGAAGAAGAAGVAGVAGAAAGAIAIPTGLDLPTDLTVQDITTGAVVGVGTAVAVIAREIEQCMVRTCSGNNNLSNLLHDALGIADLAAVAAFLAAVINHPAAAEQEYANIIAGITRPLVSGGGDILGVIEHALAL